jgi:UPF0755 protein
MARLKILIITCIVIFLGGLIWWNQGGNPVNKNDSTVKAFTISKGEGLRSIAKKLDDEGLIKNSIVFFLTVKINNIDKNIQAGQFQLSPSMDLSTIIEKLGHGTFDESVTIPEGLRNEEIAEILNKKLKISKDLFLTYAKIGYMFPDTYKISKNATEEEIADQMKNTFQIKWQSVGFSRETAKNLIKNLSEEQIIIFASIIEREALHFEDFPIIAGILLKRYNTQMPLEVDATVQYALGYNAVEKTWWKKNLTVDDLKINSPYNTRKFANLPPTPISNPGEKALRAVINYQDSPYWFYISDAKGTTHYAKNLDEHNQNVAKYL